MVKLKEKFKNIKSVEIDKKSSYSFIAQHHFQVNIILND